MENRGGAGSAARGASPPSELRLRVVSGVALAAIALFATWVGGVPFGLFWFAAAIAVAVEWIGMITAEPRAILLSLLSAGVAAVAVAYRLDAGLPMVLGLALAVLCAVAVVPRSAPMRAWAAAGFVCAALIATVPPLVRDRPDLGALAVLWMFAVVWTTDVAAYFTGRRFGGPKLWPAVSPKKTWSGFAGGLAGAMLAGTALVYAGGRFGAEPPVGLVAVAIASGLASLASQAGDLAESAMKRRFGVKDSGRLIPGHGGVMDRLDGFAAVACLVGLALAGARLAGR